jgi:hypothetical protein
MYEAKMVSDDGGVIFLGCFTAASCGSLEAAEKAAAEAYDERAREAYGALAECNFDTDGKYVQRTAEPAPNVERPPIVERVVLVSPPPLPPGFAVAGAPNVERLPPGPSPPPQTRDLISGFRGVSFNKQWKKYQAHIYDGTHNEDKAKKSRLKFLGYHRTAEEAARAYDQAAHHLRGNKANLNFPEDIPLYDETIAADATQAAAIVGQQIACERPADTVAPNDHRRLFLPPPWWPCEAEQMANSAASGAANGGAASGAPYGAANGAASGAAGGEPAHGLPALRPAPADRSSTPPSQQAEPRVLGPRFLEEYDDMEHGVLERSVQHRRV